MNHKPIHVSSLCRRAGISRWGYYKQIRQRQRREIQEEGILNVVRRCRQRHTQMGTRKLLVKLLAMGFDIGRDRLLKLLRSRHLLIRRRRRFQRTTDSQHRFYTYPNQLQHAAISGAHQAWVSDLTYIRTAEGYLYLALITDVGSRKIIGYSVNDTLEAEGCIEALKMALEQLPGWARPIHHSDRGIQYCCQDYTHLLRSRKFIISMTEENHCYENAIAERVNGILKHEYLLNQRFVNKKMARLACRQAIALYNTDRPHLALGMRTPEQAHAA
jgi:transposase InsO family protein